MKTASTKAVLDLKALMMASVLFSALNSKAQSDLPIRVEIVRKSSAACKIAALKKMGWSVKYASGRSEIQATSTRCDVKNLKDFAAQIHLTSAPNHPQEISLQDEQVIDRAFESKAQLCLYQRRVNVAVESVTKKLTDSYLYWFQMPWSPRIVWLGNMQKHWQSDPVCKNQCFTARPGQQSQALTALGKSFFTSDCAVASQLTELSVVQEVFGAEEFERNFSADEVAIGEWSDVRNSKSFMRGNKAQRLNFRQGFAYAEAGYQSLVGVSGYVGSRFDESFLDSKSSRNQNFVVTATSERALAELDAHDGLAYYSQVAEEIWKLSKQMSFSEVKALEDLAYWGEIEGAGAEAIAQAISTDSFVQVSPAAIRAAQLLSSSFLVDTKVYVHPLGIKTLSWHIAHLLRINPRTPYGVFLYGDAVHGEAYTRWVQSNFDQDCEVQ